jgi:L-threonylcarbamoyladenylate synthase
MSPWNGEDPQQVRLAAVHLAQGGLLGMPTETVYGLAARADDDAACTAIFKLKGRPRAHPLIVHTADVESAWSWARSVPDAAKRLAAAHWPGPLTLVLPRHPEWGRVAAAGAPTIALRVPQHPVARSLLAQAQGLGVRGVAAPSANRFGRVSPTSAIHVLREFGESLKVLDGGICSAGIESAIVDCTADPPRLLRPGVLDATRLAQSLGVALASEDRTSPRVPGSLAAHYAPAAQLELLDRDQLTHRCRRLPATDAARTAVWSSKPQEGVGHWLPMPDNPDAAAHQLFGVLREFDDRGCSLILVEAPTAGICWDAVRDRLSRAAVGSGSNTTHALLVDTAPISGIR